MKKKMIVLMMSVLMVFNVMALGACGGEKYTREDTLKITVSNLGFNTQWLRSIAKEFENVYNVKVDISETVIQKDLLTQLEAGYQLDDLCFFAGTDYAWTTIRKGLFTEIDDVWSATPEGETQSAAEKTLSVFRDGYKYSGHYYSLPFILETGGLAYNETTLNSVLGDNWTLPKTSYELYKLSGDIKDGGAYAFTWSNKENSCYWVFLTDTWTAQYDGAKNFTEAHYGNYYDEVQDKYVLAENAEFLSQKGKLKAYEAAYPLIQKGNGYSHQYSTSMTFAESQAAFAGIPYTSNDKKPVAFTPAGSWLYEESQADFLYKNQSIGFMKVPLLSSVVEQLSFYAEQGGFDALAQDKKVKYDKALSAIVSYVDDNTKTKPETVEGFVISNEDIKVVTEARNILYTKDQAHAFIPHNSVNPSLAKSFLKFFTSDYAGDIYSSVTHGFNPFSIKLNGNDANIVKYDRDVYAALTSSNNAVSSDIRSAARVTNPAVENNFFTTGTNDTPQKLYDYYVTVNTRNWPDILVAAGLKLL